MSILYGRSRKRGSYPRVNLNFKPLYFLYILWLTEFDLQAQGMLTLPLACLVPTLALALNSPAFVPSGDHTSKANDSIEAVDTFLRCNDTQFGRGLIAVACNVAITLLPDDKPGDVHFDPQIQEYIYPEFSRWSQEERHRLPIAREHGGCVVLVQMSASAYYDSSSWRILALRAQNVVENCVRKGGGIGGIVPTGERRKIEIVVKSNNVLYEGSTTRNGSVGIS